MSITALVGRRVAAVIRLLKSRPHSIESLCTSVGMSCSKHSTREMRHLVYALLEAEQIYVVNDVTNPRERTYRWRNNR